MSAPDPNATRADKSPQEMDATYVPPATSDDAGKTVIGQDGDATFIEDHRAGPASGNAPSKTEVAGKSATAPKKKKSINKLGDFKLVRKLGQGGMGEVFLAHQISLDRKAALKVLAKQFAGKEDFVKRFYREARSMAKIDHPNAVRVFAVDQDQGVHFVAMEFIDGKSMQDWMDEKKRLSVADALHVTLRCAEALQFAHDSGLIHRDIKPDNIMVTSRGGVKVADFGLAKAVDEELSMTQSGTGLGTPYYMAPEQGRNAKHVDARADIYALGCTLYYFLTGNLPFSGGSTVEVLLAKEQGRFERVRKFNAEVPERLELMVEKMMAKDLKVRYATCADVINDLSGMALDNPSLSFITAEDKVVVSSTSATRSSGAMSRPVTGASQSSSRLPKDTTPQSGNSAAPGDRNPEEMWQVQYTAANGRPQIGKMTTLQIQKGLQGGVLDAKAKVRRRSGESFLPIAQFPEFERAVQGALVKAQADAKAQNMKSMYAQIDRQHRWRKWTRWFGDLGRGAVGWVGFAIFLAVIGGVIYGIYLAFPHIYEFVANKLGVA